jgi:hypothetical protein
MAVLHAVVLRISETLTCGDGGFTKAVITPMMRAGLPQPTFGDRCGAFSGLPTLQLLLNLELETYCNI